MPLTIITNSVTSINTTTATCGGNSISGTVTGSITAKGVCWNTIANPTVSLTTKTNDGTGNANFTSSITSLTSGTTYYVRAYVTDGSGTYYGSNIVFTTLGLSLNSPLTSITETSAISTTINVNGFTSVSSVGVCWNTITTPTTSNNKTVDVLVGNSFTSNLTGLISGTLYYVRAYVVSNGVTYYSNQVSFTTSSVTPTVTTSSIITSITSSGATILGTVVSSGGNTVTARGVEISLNSNMSGGTLVPSGTGGTGSYSVVLTGLNSATTYYIRAYATNSNGTSYGAIYNFTTLGGPVVETVIPYSISSNTAQTGCSVLLTGGSAVTARGVVISTLSNPTLATASVFTDSYPGNGTQYLVKLIGLSKDTTYYVRAYATNAQGTSYGEELIFSTKPCNPYVEDCNYQEESTIECTDVACEYIIPATCVSGGFNLQSLCDDASSENNLINQLQAINDKLCQLSTEDYAIFIIGSIINNPILKTVFCDIKRSCPEIPPIIP